MDFEKIIREKKQKPLYKFIKKVVEEEIQLIDKYKNRIIADFESYKQEFGKEPSFPTKEQINFIKSFDKTFVKERFDNVDKVLDFLVKFNKVELILVNENELLLFDELTKPYNSYEEPLDGREYPSLAEAWFEYLKDEIRTETKYTTQLYNLFKLLSDFDNVITFGVLQKILNLFRDTNILNFVQEDYGNFYNLNVSFIKLVVVDPEKAFNSFNDMLKNFGLI